MKIEPGKSYWVNYANDVGEARVLALSEDGERIVAQLMWWPFKGKTYEVAPRHFITEYKGEPTPTEDKK